MTIDRSVRPPTAADQVGAVDAERTFRSSFFLTNEFGLLALILIFGAAFGLGTAGFLSPFNLFTLGRTMSIDIMIGFSMMVVIVTGGLNLSVGAIGACAAMGFGWLIEGAGLPWFEALVGALGLAAGLGLINGFVITRSGLHSFIITLASMSIFFGAMLFLTRAQSFRELPSDFTQFGKMKVFGPVSVLLVVSIVVGFALICLYRFTAVGREMLAAGAKSAVAQMSGIKVNRVFIFCHMLSGILAAIAAIMVVARNGAAIPAMAGQLGQDWLLPAFLGPVLGGTALTGGRVSVLGTFLGASLVTVLTNGLLLLRVGEFWVLTFLGLLLLLAVFMDSARKSYLAHRRIVA